jgi:acetaldehyde dehydrogenase (acetylating)
MFQIYIVLALFGKFILLLVVGKPFLVHRKKIFDSQMKAHNKTTEAVIESTRKAKKTKMPGQSTGQKPE